MKQRIDLLDKLSLQEKVLVECGKKLSELKEQMQRWKTVKDSIYRSRLDQDALKSTLEDRRANEIILQGGWELDRLV